MRRLLLILVFILLPFQVFATTTLYVDTDATSPTHPTYSSLNAAITYLQGDNGGVLDDDFVIECGGAAADTAAIDTTGITTSTANTLTIRPADTDKHGGFFDASKYHISVSTDDAINLKAGNETIDGIQLRTTASYKYAIEVYNTGGSDGGDGVSVSVIRNCLIYGTTNANARGIYTSGYSSGVIIYNNILIAGESNDTSINRIDGDVWILNNTISGGWNVGINTGGNRLRYAHNNTSVDNDTDFTGTWTAASNNISSDDSAPGPNSLINQIATDLMTDPANGDYTLKSGSNAIDAGTDLSAYFTIDITGATRSAPWDIGAFAYATASGWSGTIYGITPAKIMGVPVSDMSKVGGVE